MVSRRTAVGSDCDLDDATSEIYYAQLVDQESARTVMAAIRHVVETQGW